MVGLVMGITRFAWESAYPPVLCGEEAQDKRPAVIKDVHYLHFGMLLFAVVFVTTVVISLLTKPIDDKHVSFAAGCTQYNQYLYQLQTKTQTPLLPFVVDLLYNKLYNKSNTHPFTTCH